MKIFFSRVRLWNLFFGLVIGFGLGVFFMNALIPDAGELVRIYRLDKQSMADDRAARAAGLQGTLEIEGN